MSRTDVHRPAWVKEKDPVDRRHFVERHTHLVRDRWDQASRKWLVQREVPCDLDVFLASKGYVHTRCRLAYVGGRNIYCGCDMCTGKTDHRLDRRRNRREARAEIRRATVDR